MARIPTSKVVRRRDGDVVTVNSHEIDGELYTTNNVAKVVKRGRVPLQSAPRDLGQPAEFGRIGR